MTLTENRLAERLLVCVDGCADREPSGRLYSPLVGSLGFSGVVPLINGMEQFFDGYHHTQSTNMMRSFGKKTLQQDQKTPVERRTADMANNKAGEETIRMQDTNGRQATFVINVIYRQNASWQGKIQWIEDKKEQSFRSALELIKLMDDALSSGDTAQQFDGWSNEIEHADAAEGLQTEGGLEDERRGKQNEKQ